jgi:hypothetical protein
MSRSALGSPEIAEPQHIASEEAAQCWGHKYCLFSSSSLHIFSGEADICPSTISLFHLTLTRFALSCSKASSKQFLWSPSHSKMNDPYGGGQNDNGADPRNMEPWRKFLRYNQAMRNFQIQTRAGANQSLDAGASTIQSAFDDKDMLEYEQKLAAQQQAQYHQQHHANQGPYQSYPPQSPAQVQSPPNQGYGLPLNYPYPAPHQAQYPVPYHSPNSSSPPAPHQAPTSPPSQYSQAPSQAPFQDPNPQHFPALHQAGWSQAPAPLPSQTQLDTSSYVGKILHVKMISGDVFIGTLYSATDDSLVLKQGKFKP